MARGTIGDPDVRAYLAHARNARRRATLVVHGQVFDAELTTFVETAERGRAGYEATFGLTHAQGRSVLDMTYSDGGQTWTPDDLGRVALDHLLGKSGGQAPRHVALPSPLDWRAVEARAGGIPELVAVVGSLLVTERAVTAGIFTRVHVVEVRLVGPPRGVAVRVRGSRGAGHGPPPAVLESAIEVPLT